MKELNIVKPEEYFLEISPLKNHPDFSKIKTIIPDHDSI
jgi:hypothetical protein